MEEKKVDASCGTATGCGIKCGCYVCQSIKALVFLVVGGVLGYSIAHCGNRMCAVPPAPAMQTETTPAPTPVMPPRAPRKPK